MKHYKWHFGRLTAFAVAFLNCIFAGYVLMRVLMDDYFLYTQTGFYLDKSPIIRIGITVPIVLITLWLNLRFIRRQHHARLFVGLFQTICMACILRNIFVGFSYFGFGMYVYMRNVIAFIIVAVLIYHTLFSKNIRMYFEEA
ncbi:MAG: hypothetical protein JEZ08_14680 [Clostridiales bacterium]|nr:hypothetical protein [Clostridiales bacterium]